MSPKSSEMVGGASCSKPSKESFMICSSANGTATLIYSHLLAGHKWLSNCFAHWSKRYQEGMIQFFRLLYPRRECPLPCLFGSELQLFVTPTPTMMHQIARCQPFSETFQDSWRQGRPKVGKQKEILKKPQPPLQCRLLCCWRASAASRVVPSAPGSSQGILWWREVVSDQQLVMLDALPAFRGHTMSMWEIDK